MTNKLTWPTIKKTHKNTHKRKLNLNQQTIVHAPVRTAAHIIIIIIIIIIIKTIIRVA